MQSPRIALEFEAMLECTLYVTLRTSRAYAPRMMIVCGRSSCRVLHVLALASNWLRVCAKMPKAALLHTSATICRHSVWNCRTALVSKWTNDIIN
jgi:hypothetical protein